MYMLVVNRLTNAKQLRRSSYPIAPPVRRHSLEATTFFPIRMHCSMEWIFLSTLVLSTM